ncbi:hypothetical protein F4809DRAFT_554813 [Biscogniauxia mediterranea]|nr:hypothetical protein F4809DRAFT_554813 [Biscogniauxia mediterranea]
MSKAYRESRGIRGVFAYHSSTVPELGTILSLPDDGWSDSCLGEPYRFPSHPFHEYHGLQAPTCPACPRLIISLVKRGSRLVSPSRICHLVARPSSLAVEITQEVKTICRLMQLPQLWVAFLPKFLGYDRK